MNRRKLEQHLRDHGCELARHGGKHDVWRNPTTGVQTSVPRHRALKKSTARAVCRDLGVPIPDGM